MKNHKRKWEETGAYVLELVAADGTDRVSATLEIDVEARCSHQPESMYGGPDRVGWPAEYDETRGVVGAGITLQVGGQKIRLVIPGLFYSLIEDELGNELDALELTEVERDE